MKRVLEEFAGIILLLVIALLTIPFFLIFGLICSIGEFLKRFKSKASFGGGKG
jgi:hypothetical protein